MFEGIKDRPFIVIGAEHYNPLGIIRTLGRQGIAPIYIAIKHKCPLASLSRYVSKVHYVDNAREAYEVLMDNYSHQANKPFVLTSDDDIQGIIDLNWNVVKESFVAFNAGANGRITKYMNKKEILDCAKRHGLKTLDTVVVSRGRVPENIEYPVITKSISPNDGGWKSDVHICQNGEDLARAFGSIESDPVLIQHFIDKKTEICIDGYAVGRGCNLFMPMYTTYNYNIEGYYSPYMTVHPFDLVDLDAGIRGMLSEIGFEGIFSAEFLVDKDGTAYFTEINFRNSTWSFIATTLGMPFACLWAESMLTGSIPACNYRPVPEGYRAMVEPIDYQKRVVEGDTSLAQWIMDFKALDCPFYLDADDPRPFETMIENRELLS